MPVLYLNSDNSGSLASNLGNSGEDIRIMKMIVGAPTAAKNIYVFDINGAGAGDTANLKFKYTYPTFGAGKPASDTFSFGAAGLPLGNGGSVMTDGALQLTVVWDRAENIKLGE